MMIKMNWICFCFWFQNVKSSIIDRFAVVRQVIQAIHSLDAMNHFQKYGPEIHAYQHHAVHIQNVRLSMKVQLVHVCQHSLEHRLIVVQNVQSIQSVPLIWLVWIKNVLIHAQDHVVSIHSVQWLIIHHHVHVMLNIPEIHSKVVCRFKVSTHFFLFSFIHLRNIAEMPFIKTTEALLTREVSTTSNNTHKCKF